MWSGLFHGCEMFYVGKRQIESGGVRIEDFELCLWRKIK